MKSRADFPPLKPSAGAVRAARLLLTQVDECLRHSETFALETTLSGKTCIRLFPRARKLGYEIELHYRWLSSPTQAIACVRQRVQQGGHHVPAGDIRRRFKRSLVHLLDDYLLGSSPTPPHSKPIQFAKLLGVADLRSISGGIFTYSLWT